MRQVHDYEAFHVEFLKSWYDEVKWFLSDKWVKYNSRRATRTKWRSKEKQELKQRIVEDTMKEIQKQQVSELQVPLEDLMKWKKAIIQLLLLQVWKYVKDSKWEDWTVNDVDVVNAEKILRMFKTELWEPNTIWANYNMNASKVEWLSEEESEALDMLFDTKIKKVK